LTDSHYKGSDAVLILFDLTDIESYRNVDQWYEWAFTKTKGA